MYRLFLLFLPLNLFAQIWTDTIYFNEHLGGIRYYGPWKESIYGKISDRDTEDTEIFYRAWMGGFDLYTFVDAHHGGYWINVDGNRTYVNMTEENRAVKRTFSVRNLNYGNHNITITPSIDSTFVFQKIIKFVDSSPLEPPCIDTIYFDSVRWTTKINWIDSIIFNYKDTTVVYYDTVRSRTDTLQPKIYIKADDIIYELN